MTGREIVQELINVMSLGSIYALLALGLAMVFSILGLVNFAFGELVTVGAYTIYLEQKAGLPFVVQAISAVVAASAASVLMERMAFRPLRNSGFVTLLLSSFAVSVIFQNAFLIGVSPRQQGVPFPGVFNEVVRIGPYVVGWLQIATAATALVGLGALTVFLRRSSLGLGMLAASQDFAVARLMGIAANRAISTAFAISGALAGLAAIFLLARRGTVDPGMGFVPLLKAFLATIIGGLGSLSGAVFGGFLLATLEVGFDATLPGSVQPFRDAFVVAIIIGILYMRPHGLLTARSEVR